jgi:hypothetical protein
MHLYTPYRGTCSDALLEKGVAEAVAVAAITDIDSSAASSAAHRLKKMKLLEETAGGSCS